MSPTFLVAPPGLDAVCAAVFIVLRNMTPPLRLWSMSLYGWLGCITLETCEARLLPVALVTSPFCKLQSGRGKGWDIGAVVCRMGSRTSRRGAHHVALGAADSPCGGVKGAPGSWVVRRDGSRTPVQLTWAAGWECLRMAVE